MKNQRPSSLIDLSHPVSHRMPVYPGDERPQLKKVKYLKQDGFSNFLLSGSMHIGTHIDGPMHMINSKLFIDGLAPDQFVGRGCLLNARGMNIVSSTPEFSSIIIPGGIVVVFTGFGKHYGTKKYFQKHPVLDMDLARLMVHRRIKMVCLDTPSPDRYPYDVHKYLFNHSVLIAENLANVEKLLGVKRFEVMAFPLRIHADSSPARIIARREEGRTVPRPSAYVSPLRE